MGLLDAPDTMPVAVLSDDDYTALAAKLNCEVPAIKAVSTVETGSRGPFQSDGRPTILFERHIFHGLTAGRFDLKHPDISNSVPGGYGLFSAQYGRIQIAYGLDPEAALKSASWGAFQIMGENFASAGFTSVDDMVVAMRSGVAAHLQAFGAFIESNYRLLTAIRGKDWATFALHYNGPSYAKNQYDIKLAAAYRENA